MEASARNLALRPIWLAGIPVPDPAVLELTRRLREADLDTAAERLERASDREAKIGALDITDREAILRVLEDCPDELLELRATLVQESRLAAAGWTLVEHRRL